MGMTNTMTKNGRIICSAVAKRKLGKDPGSLSLLRLQNSNGAAVITSMRGFASKNNTAADGSIPFYGTPREPNTGPRSVQSRISLAIHHATAAFSDPTRADAVAALGEITGTVSLERMYQKMMQDETGRQILEERPIISKATIPYERLISEAPHDPATPGITFGQAYGCFLKSHGFDPDERDEIKYIEDETLAYIMLRYRQCHDFWHTLTGLPPTVLGELGIKWLELFQTGLPVAALSSTVGSLRLDPREREILIEQYLPWAMEISRNSTCSLMNVYYEKEFDTPLEDLRERLNIKPAPKVDL